MVFVVPRHRGDYSARGSEKIGVVKAIVPPRAEAVANSALIHGGDVGISCVEPGGWRDRRRPEHGSYAVRVQHLQSTVEPGEIEPAFFRLLFRRGKFSEAHKVDPRLLHHRGIFFPLALTPGFRVVVHAVNKAAAIPGDEIEGLGHRHVRPGPERGPREGGTGEEDKEQAEVRFHGLTPFESPSDDGPTPRHSHGEEGEASLLAPRRGLSIRFSRSSALTALPSTPLRDSERSRTVSGKSERGSRQSTSFPPKQPGPTRNSILSSNPAENWWGR